MKIAGTGRSEAPPARRKSRAGADSDSVFRVSGGSTQESGEVAGSAPVAPIGALLSIQEVDDSGEKRRRPLDRADEMLDLLDELRHGLLAGSVSQGRLRHLLALANAGTDEFADPHLRGILSEIELRAKVELAKIEAVRTRP